MILGAMLHGTPAQQVSTLSTSLPTPQSSRQAVSCLSKPNNILCSFAKRFLQLRSLCCFEDDYLQMSEHGLLGLSFVVLFTAYECIHTCICPTAKLCLLQGCTLYSNYGNKSNEELILGYGFALPHNEADFFHVMVGLAGTSKPEAGGDYCALLSPFLSSYLWHAGSFWISWWTVSIL